MKWRSRGSANEARDILALDRRGITAYRSLGRSVLFEARSARKSGNDKRRGIGFNNNSTIVILSTKFFSNPDPVRIFIDDEIT